MRPGRPSIWARQRPEAQAQLKKQAEQLCVSVRTEGEDFHATATNTNGLNLKAGSETIVTPPLSLYGSHQTQNAALALMALKTSCLVTNMVAAAKGAGQASKASRSQIYGNTNLMTGDLLDGNQGIFKQRDDRAVGQLIGDPMNTTGYVDGGTSMTVQPQLDPEVSGQMAMDRIQMIAAGGQYPGLNNRQSIYGA